MNIKKLATLSCLLLLLSTMTYYTAFASDVTFSSYTPGIGSTVTTSLPTVSVYVKSATYDLNDSSVSATINGQPASASFQYRGHWAYHSCIGNYWVTDSYKEGTLTVQPPVLPDGSNTVTVSIKNSAGTLFTQTWSFTVSEPPKFANRTPAAGSVNTAVNRVSAVVTDNTDVNWNSMVVYINNNIVAHSVDHAARTVSYDYNFASGSYTVKMQAKDTAGNLGESTWSFTVDPNPPSLSRLSNFSNGMTITNGNLKFNAELTDVSDIKSNTKLYLNGSPLSAAIKYEGYSNYYGYWVVTSKKKVYVDYQGVIPDGNHTLSLYAEDILGNHITRTWPFTVATPPVISNVSPTGGIQVFTPLISATVKDPNGTVQSCDMKIDGVLVQHTYNPATDLVSYTPEVPFENESYHNVTLTVTDNSGLQTTKSWSFYTNTYPDMYDAGIDGCLTCHSLYSGVSNGAFESVHKRRLSFGGTHSSNDCAYCHNYVTVGAGCAQCHGDVDFDYAPHGSSPGITYSAKNSISGFALRVTNNREMWDCVICHQPGAGTKTRSGRLLNNHDIPNLHTSTTASGCEACHARSLTREHARAGRTDNAGQAINCQTCHATTASSTVKSAVTGKNTDCFACHTMDTVLQGHPSHTVTYGGVGSERCISCHGDRAINEKVFHTNSNCGTCHLSTQPRVKLAVERQKGSCFACHEEPHGLMMFSYRDDIPLYSGTVSAPLSWSKPDSATAWSGERWMPEELKSSAVNVVYSNRTAMDAASVYEFYTAQMATGGWTVINDTYLLGATHFELVYQKDRRLVKVWYYSGSVPEAVNIHPRGSRIIIAYH